MSTMRVTTLKNEASSVDQIVLNADGSFGGELAAQLGSKLDAGAGRVLQVVSTTKTDTFSTTSTSFVAITGLSVSITPSSASSKVLIIAAPSFSEGGSNSGNTLQFALYRDGSVVSGYTGDAAGSRTRSVGIAAQTSNVSNWNPSVCYLDSPNTTSATTYAFYMLVNAGTGYLNRSINDSDNASYGRTASTITVMEVSG